MAFKSGLQLTANRLGSGQFGNVFEGHELPHGKVAVKVINKDPTWSDSEWAAQSAQMLGEAQNLQKAIHPNVVRVIGLARDAVTDVVHMTIEFCDGGSVETEYKQGPMPVRVVRKIATDACRGLAHVHSCGMLHRDIKPGNILKHGTNYKIGDFGLVTDKMVLGYANAAGYVAHLAPEVFINPATGAPPGLTSIKTDIWAMGMTVYRLLHGHDFYKKVFNSKNIQAMITAGGFSACLPWLPHVPHDWRRFVRKAMHDNTKQRFQSAHEMSQAISKLQVEPNWNCVYGTASVNWTCKRDNRDVTVTWTVHSPRKHEWVAKRTGGGRRDQRVGGTNGTPVSKRVAVEQLENFFGGLT